MKNKINLGSGSLTKKYSNHSNDLKSKFVKGAKSCHSTAKPIKNVRNKT